MLLALHVIPFFVPLVYWLEKQLRLPYQRQFSPITSGSSFSLGLKSADVFFCYYGLTNTSNVLLLLLVPGNGEEEVQ
jgi:hypothetical protein